jgi:hypothetical protein
MFGGVSQTKSHLEVCKPNGLPILFVIGCLMPESAIASEARFPYLYAT